MSVLLLYINLKLSVAFFFGPSKMGIISLFVGSLTIGDCMMEHKRAGVGKLSSDLSSSESSDSNAANGLRWKKRDVQVGETMMCTRGNVEGGRGEVLLKEVKRR